MSDTTYERGFPRLNDSNYAEWSMRMEAELIRRKLWDGIITVSVATTETEPEKVDEETKKVLYARDVQKMAEARAEMILRAEDGQLAHMRSRDPREIWQTLAEVHKARGFATQLAMKRHFLTAKKRSDQTMQAWIGNIRSMAFRMGEADIVVSEQDQILAVTMGLPPSYDTVIIALDSTPTEQLTLEHVISRLLNEEIRQSSSGAPQSHPRSRDPGVAAATTKALIRGEMPKGRLIDRSEVQCYFCDDFGHFKSECPEKAKWETEKAKTKEAEAAGGHSAILATTFGPVAGAW